MKELIKDNDAEIVRLSNENALLKSDLEKYESKKMPQLKTISDLLKLPLSLN